MDSIWSKESGALNKNSNLFYIYTQESLPEKSLRTLLDLVPLFLLWCINPLLEVLQTDYPDLKISSKSKAFSSKFYISQKWNSHLSHAVLLRLSTLVVCRVFFHWVMSPQSAALISSHPSLCFLFRAPPHVSPSHAVIIPDTAFSFYLSFYSLTLQLYSSFNPLGIFFFFFRFNVFSSIQTIS